MRLSLSQQVQNSLIHLNSASLRLAAAQNRAASGKRILRGSDDVPGTDRALSFRSAISTLEQLSDNTTVAKPLLQVTDKALDDLSRAIRSVRDIAVAAASSLVTDSARNAYALQLDDILNEMEDTANTRFMDQYVFSGTASDSPAVVAQAGPPPYAYDGNSGMRRTQILSGVTVALNIPGDRVFNLDGQAGGGTTDVFTMVTQLRDAIANGSVSEVSAQIENIDGNLDNVLANRSRVGSWMMRLERAQEVLTDTKLRLREMLSNTEDIDLPTAVVEMQAQENVYQAALGVSSRILNLSLASLKYL